MIRKAKFEELSTVMNVINEAWRITLGDSGIAYKRSGRFRSVEEIEPYKDDFYVIEANDEIVGAVRLIFIGDLVSIGSLAVLPRFQV